jgi:hypothetical protein
MSEITFKVPTATHLGNTTLVKQNGGYSKAFKSDLEIKRNCRLLLTFLRSTSHLQHIREEVKAGEYLYNPSKKEFCEWDTLRIKRDHYKKLLNMLENDGIIERQTANTRGAALYKINLFPLKEDFQLPHLFLYSEKLSWDEKNNLFQIALILQCKKEAQSVTYTIQNNKMMHKELQLTNSTVYNLAEKLTNLGFISTKDEIDFHNLLLDISTEVFYSATLTNWKLTEENMRLKSALKKFTKTKR